MNEWVNLFNEAIDGVRAKIALHICFGSVGGRPGGKRSYRWMVPQILDARADQFVLEFASRELKELELWGEFAGRGEVGVGVVDVKWSYVETAEEIAERLRAGSDIRSRRKTLREPGLRFFSSAAKRCLTKNAQHGRWHVNRPRGNRHPLIENHN